MKRLITMIVVVSAAIASYVWAQSASQATLRTAAGDHAVSTIKKGDQTFFAVDETIAALGGTATKERQGVRVKLGNVDAAVASDTRFAVVREDLIEMPSLPMVVDNKMYVNWQFFDGLLRRAASQEMSFDAATNILSVRPAAVEAVEVNATVVDLGEISKLVMQFSRPVEYTITREPLRYVVQFAAPLKSAVPEQTFESALVSKVAFGPQSADIVVTADNVVGDPYRLDNPYRLVIDLKKGTASIPSATPFGGALKPVEQPGIRTIVIDAGHGGKDVGATGPTGLLEKETTLAICRKLSSIIERKLGARVILTRSDDTLIPLDQRTAIANQYKADLFLSVHLNAAVVRGARGSETYFLSLEASDELARRAAEHENEAAAGLSAPNNSGADLDLILWDLAQQDYMKESSRLAEFIQEEMNTLNNIQNRGVKQAPFKVLVGATMPAALVEVAFISNPDEETKLRDGAYQDTVANALAEAVSRYKTEYETRIGLIRPAPPAPAAAAASTAPAAAAPAATTTASAAEAAKKNPGRP
jgi:N-acetylmuramoyl-L-alanine amidase